MRYSTLVSRLGLVPALLGVTVSCAGCGLGSNSTLNAKSLDSQIANQLKARYPIIRATVTCPGGVKETVGETFSCSATLDGQKADLTGRVTSTGGRYNIQPAEAIIVNAQAAATLQQRISAQLQESVTVDCGTSVLRVVAVGNHFSCDATLPGQTRRPVTVTVKDTSGDMSFAVTTG